MVPKPALCIISNPRIMKSLTRVLIVISVALMLGAYFLPLWHILLDAPQYPEGLEMKIWLNGLSGNIAQINGLNHYIGMKLISVDDFKEFTILPYVFGLLLLVGIASAIIKSRKLLWTWFIGLCLFGVIGFSDFYKWEYNYGHNLNPHAAIKVEGMNYQPPLFGYKQLLNFTAGSLPDAGGILVGLGGVLAAAALFYKPRLSPKKLK
jgi:copper chaperone NosL